jgi:hypothetical protein
MRWRRHVGLAVPCHVIEPVSQALLSAQFMKFELAFDRLHVSLGLRLEHLLCELVDLSRCHVMVRHFACAYLFNPITNR